MCEYTILHTFHVIFPSLAPNGLTTVERKRARKVNPMRKTTNGTNSERHFLPILLAQTFCCNHHQVSQLSDAVCLFFPSFVWSFREHCINIYQKLNWAIVHPLGKISKKAHTKKRVKFANNKKPRMAQIWDFV